jgi:hypothetical protein
LTPPGPVGDEIIRQLASRLIEIDLLDRAGELLQHQVEYRVKGPEKVELGTRLAGLRLLDNRPEQALRALELSEQSGIPPDQLAERRVLRARALASLERRHEAMQALSGDETRPANLLRVDWAWKDRDWPTAAEVLAKVIGPPPAGGARLDEETARLVLNRAVALALSGDVLALEQLRREFAAAMAGTSDADAFTVLTRSEQFSGLSDLKTIRSKLSEVGIFQSFLNKYRGKRASPGTGTTGTPPSPSTGTGSP